MPAFGQYGASPFVAQFQGFVNSTPALVTRAAQNCTVTRSSAGVFVMTINTGSVDDANYLAMVTQYGEAVKTLAISYGTPAANQITFTFGTPTDPGTSDLFNIVVTQCTDGVDNTPGSP